MADLNNSSTPNEVATSPSAAETLSQPLLSVRTNTQQHHTTPPPHAFFQIRDRNETEEQHRDEETPVMGNGGSSFERHEEDSFVTSTLGRRFCMDPLFWRRLLGASILGITTSAATQGLLWLIDKTLSLWTTERDFSWVYTTLTGGFISGLILLLLGNPKLPYIPHDFIRTMSFKDSTALVCAGSLTLASGAPLGPEVVVLALGQSLAAVIQNLDPSGFVCFQHCGVAASVTSLCGITLLGPLLVFEVLAAIVSSFQVVEGSGHYAESMLLQVVAATLASCMKLWLSPFSYKEPALNSINLSLESSVTSNAVKSALLAVPIGILCGCIGASLVVLSRSLAIIRRVISGPLLTGPSPWFPSLLFPTLAGAGHGLLALSSPMALGSGLDLSIELWQNLSSGGDSLPGSRQLMFTLLAKFGGVALSAGFGLVGGTVMPAGNMGLILGLLLHHVQFLKTVDLQSLTASCIVATVASVAPLPLTGVVFAVSITGGGGAISSNSIVLVLTATVVAAAVTSGLIRSHTTMGDAASSRGESDHSENNELGNNHGLDEVPNQSDEEILANVRQTIFAGTQ